jgi:tetratricopeptide (TPR) repeat protein
MRAETYMVVDPRRDHSFRVPRPDLSVSLGTPNACGDCHRDEGPEWAASRVREWFPEGRSDTFHYGEAIAAGRNWSADRAALLERTASDATLPAIARATAVGLLSEHVDAEAVEVVTRALEDDEPLVQLAALEALESLPAERRAALGQRFLTHPLRALRVTAARVLAPAREGLSERRRADLDAALNEYVAVQRFNADTAEATFNLASLAATLGRASEAEDAYRRIIEREPAFSPAYANLADLYRSVGREADAETALRAGLAINPDDAALSYALGLSLARSARVDEALSALERAAALAPGEPLYGYAVGLALVSAGGPGRAIESLEAASRAFPGYVPALFALATLYRDEGDIERALQYVRQALEISPSDPGARALLAELENRAQAR